MPLRSLRTLTAAAALSLAASVVSAQDSTPALEAHIRPETPAIRTLIQDASRRSPAIQELVAQIEAADVTVYIRMRPFSVMDLDGQMALLAATAGGHRYMLIELACGRSELRTIATLGHELFHTLEVARDPDVVDSRSLAAHYTRAGRQTDRGAWITFETAGAVAAGDRVLRELLSAEARSTWSLK